MVESEDLLRTKLMPPRVQDTLLERPRLFARLDAGLSKKMTLISAPTGSGKSTLASAWLANRRCPAAWVTLDAGDNDPVRFWRYVITACQALDGAAGKNALAGLRTMRQPSFTALLTGWLNDLSQLPQQAVLVLEDYHTITSAEVHASLAFLIEHLPEPLHLILITRGQPAPLPVGEGQSPAAHSGEAHKDRPAPADGVPPAGGVSSAVGLPLALLRARNELNELRAADLQFTTAEIEAFLHRALPQGEGAEQRMAIHLEEKTEGWAAGLRLALLALQGSPAPEQAGQVIEAFSGAHHTVLDYLGREVLERQPEPLRAFLLQTCFLSRLTGSLCDAVTGRVDSGALLRQIEQANLFLVPLHGGGGAPWYRYQSLFAGAARQYARQALGEAAVRAVQARASQWYEAHGLLDEAVETALEAAQYPRAAGLIESFIQRGGGNEIHTLRRWFERMPAGEVEQRPELCFSFLLALLFSMDRYAPATAARLEPLMAAAEAGWKAAGDQAGLGRLAAVRGTVAWWQGDLGAAFAQARCALGLLRESDLLWRGTALLGIGYEAYLAGRLYEAQDRLMEARALCGAAQNIHGVLASIQMMGESALLQGELEQAGAYFRQVLEDAVGGEEMLDDQSLAWLGLASIHYEQNDLPAAAEMAERASQMARQRADETMLVQSTVLLARVGHARGQGQQAQAGLQSLAARTRLRFLVRDLQACRAWLQIDDGDLDSARQLVHGLQAQSEPVYALQAEREGLLAARLLLAEGHHEAALDVLRPWRQDAQANGRTRSEIAILCLEAACTAPADPDAAARTLASALALAHPKGLRRVILDLGAPVMQLLRAAAPQLSRRSLALYATALLHSSPGGGQAKHASQPGAAGVTLEPLSPQEMRVLRLIATGRTNPEIAQELVVSINTIKTQVRSIYRKLNVETRDEARAAAQALRII
jgi:LuxR family transcriptional regulator, maltose regulon positive regulatory protein